MSYNDYYPFGMLMPNRHQSSDGYRYGYQGSEKDDEVKGVGNSYTTLFRQLDARLGRWLSLDLKGTASESPYVSMGNNPIWHNDVLGDTIKISHRKGFLGLEKKEKLVYRNGKLFDSKGKKEYKGKIKGFLKITATALNKIEEKKFGNELVDAISDGKTTITIRKGYKNKQGGKNVYFSGVGGSTINADGSVGTPAFVSLAHELAHAYDRFFDDIPDLNENFTIKTCPNKPETYFSTAEIYSVNVENLIRQEHNIPLRTRYGVGFKRIYLLYDLTLFNKVNSIKDDILYHHLKKRNFVEPLEHKSELSPIPINIKPKGL